MHIQIQKRTIQEIYVPKRDYMRMPFHMNDIRIITHKHPTQIVKTTKGIFVCVRDKDITDYDALYAKTPLPRMSPEERKGVKAALRAFNHGNSTTIPAEEIKR